ncbi:radical SAM/SPASM domain-containing protein [Rubripirellula tenax]
MDCNLGCYYCYESRSKDCLGEGDLTGLLEHVSTLIENGGKPRSSLHVDWYGGEPLLNMEFLDSASRAIQAYCLSQDVKYSASIISNGTEWPDDPCHFVRHHKIRQAQISFDGLKRNHDRRRRYRKGYKPHGEASSFELAIALVDQLLDATHVDVRFNIDKNNQDDLLPFFRMAQERGWFNRRFPMTIQPARLSSYSETSAFMRSHELTVDQFDKLRKEVRNEFGELVTVEESEVPDGYPYPRTSVCAALSHSSSVVGAEGKLYRCGLQVGEHGRSVGSLPRTSEPAGNKLSLPIIEDRNDEQWWANFDPTTQPKCSVCSFLPICWSGCPKKHLENDDHAIAEQGAYWRSNLPRLVADRVDADLVSLAPLSESLQFRSAFDGANPTCSTNAK